MYIFDITKKTKMIRKLLCSGSRSFSSIAKPVFYNVVGGGSGMRCTMQANEGKGVPMTTDIPRPSVKADAPLALEMFLAALCGCELSTAQFVARNMTPRVTIDKIDFDVHGVRDKDGVQAMPLGQEASQIPPSRLQRIWGEALVYTNASQEEIDKIAHEVKIRCPIASMVIQSGCALEVQWKKAQ